MASPLTIALALALALGSALPAQETAPGPAAPAATAPAPLVLKKYAGDVFTLEPFFLHIPLDDDGDGLADLVTMPLLRLFEDPQFFRLSPLGDQILFRVRRGDVRIAGADAPRCELWERKKGGTGLAAWDTRQGMVHNLTLSCAFLTVPHDGGKVVAAGVWGDAEKIAVRHEGDGRGSGRVVLSREGLDPHVLADPYEPGTTLEMMLLLDKGLARLMRSGKVEAEWPLEADGLHFRAGCVLEGGGSDPKALAEVAISKLYLIHKTN